jgi:hypothetical protein
LAIHLQIPSLATLIYDFLCKNKALGINDMPSIDAALRTVRVYVHHSAVATFYAPTDPSGIGGMRKETIRSTPSWRGKLRRDTVFLNHNPSLPGMRGLRIARVRHFLRLETARDRSFACALVHMWEVIGNEPDEDTGMWAARPLMSGINCSPVLDVVSLAVVRRASHLVPIFSAERAHWIPLRHCFSTTLDTFRSFYINKWIDHNAYAIAY